MQVREGERTPTRPAQHLHLSVERDKCRSPVASVRCYAPVARAKHRVSSIGAVQHRTARTRHALVALVIARVTEVRAARPLEHVATPAGHVAQPLRRLPQAFGQNRLMANHRRIGLQFRH